MTVLPRMTREDLLERLQHECRGGHFAVINNDVANVVDVLLEAFMPNQIFWWMRTQDDELGGCPITMLRAGQFERIAVEAHRMVRGMAEMVTL